MDTSLFRYIWRHTKPQQLWLTAIIIFSLIPYYLSLDLPKRIVNGPIIGEGFESPEANVPLMRINIDLPDWFGEIPPFLLFGGFEATQVTHLWALSLIFLSFVCINGLFKLYINTYKGRLGERTLRTRAVLNLLIGCCDFQQRSSSALKHQKWPLW